VSYTRRELRFEPGEIKKRRRFLKIRRIRNAAAAAAAEEKRIIYQGALIMPLTF
jgi:hypothetical protein